MRIEHLLVLTVFAAPQSLLAAPAAPACHLSKNFDVFQSNGYVVHFTNVTSGEPMTGRAVASPKPGVAAAVGEIVPGSHVSGSKVFLRVNWGGSEGQYDGEVDDSGGMTGITYSLKNPLVQSTWVARGGTCLK